MSGKFPGNFQEMSRKFPGNFQEMFGKCPGNFQENSGKIPENFQEISRKFPGKFHGKILCRVRSVLACHQNCPGCSGNKPAVSAMRFSLGGHAVNARLSLHPSLHDMYT